MSLKIVVRFLQYLSILLVLRPYNHNSLLCIASNEIASFCIDNRLREMAFFRVCQSGQRPVFEKDFEIKSWSCMFFLLYKTNRFHVAVGLFSNRPQRTSKCGKNISEMCSHINRRDLPKPLGRTATMSLSLSKYSKQFTWSGFNKTTESYSG